MPGRTYSQPNTSYRYSINGQEKTPEIAPNTTTAEYWQYDARIVRRWNVDPKPNIAISPYNCFAGNPIHNVDIKGDSIWVNTDGGKRLYYENNKLYKENGKEYKGGNKFAKRMLGDLNKIAEGEFGSQWISGMVKMKESLEIFRSQRGSPSFDGYTLEGDNYASGNKVYINDKGSLPNPAAPTENGLEELPRFTTLAHELFHALGSVKGNKNTDPWYKMGDKTIIKDEFFATVVENWIRNEHGLSIRTHYSTKSDNGNEVPDPASALFKNIWRLPPPCEGKPSSTPCNPSDGIIFFQYIDIWKLVMK
ncbi:MAG: hypothetical protein H6627_14975 [Calditrichae bacterium]|nr:hypothetical protein [Calditrichia bacterium]